MITDYITRGTNVIKIGLKVAGVAGLIISSIVGLSGGAVPALQVTNPSGLNLWQVSSSGAIGVGNPANFGNSGDCLKSGGSSGTTMTFGTCGAGGGGAGLLSGTGAANYVTYFTGKSTVSGSSILQFNQVNKILTLDGKTKNGNAPLQIWKSNSGSTTYTRAIMTSSGGLTESGRMVINLPMSHNPDTATPPNSDFDGLRVIGNNSGSFVDAIVYNNAKQNASSDLIAVNGAGSDTLNYADVGITSQIYNTVGNQEIGPNEVYFLSTGTNLNIMQEGLVPYTGAIKFSIATVPSLNQSPVTTAMEVARFQGPGGYFGLNTQTISPKARLTVFGSGAFTGSLSGSSLKVMSGALSYVLGKFGVKTTTPGTDLDVTGNARVSGILSMAGGSNFTSITGPAIYFGTTTTSVTNTAIGLNSTSGNGSNTGLFFPDRNTVAFGTKGVEGMRVDLNANVGIGTTKTMVSKLEVVGTVSGSTLNAGYGSVGAPGLSFGGITTGLFAISGPSLNVAVNGVNRMRWDTNANVFAGRSNAFPAGFKSTFYMSGAIVISPQGVVVATPKTGVAIEGMGTISGATLQIMSGASILNGRVSIGKSSALTALDVVGTISGSALQINGNAKVQGVSSMTLIPLTSTLFQFLTSSSVNMIFYPGNQQTLGLFTNQGASIGGAFATNTPPANGLAVQGNVGVGILAPTARLTVSGAEVINLKRGTATGSMLTVDTKGLVYDGTNKGVGIGKTSVLATLDVVGGISGSTLTVSGTPAEGSSQNALCITAQGVVQENNTTTCLVSSLRFKHDVLSMKELGLTEINKLHPVTYLDNQTNVKEMGLIAEELQKVEPMLVFYDKDGKTVRGVKYENLTALLVKGIQEEDAKVQALQDRVSTLESEVKKLLSLPPKKNG